MILFKPGTFVKIKDGYANEFHPLAGEVWMVLGEHNGHQHYAIFNPKYRYGNDLGGLITDQRCQGGTWALLHKVRLLTKEEKAAFDPTTFPTFKELTKKKKKKKLPVKRSNVRVSVEITGLSYGGNEYNIAIRPNGSVYLGALGEFDNLDEAIEFAKKVHTPAGAAQTPGVRGYTHRVALLVKYGRNLLPLLRLIKRLQNMKGRIIQGNTEGEVAQDNAVAAAAEKEAAELRERVQS